MWPLVTGPYVGAPTNYWRGGFFDFGGFDARRLTELSRLADQSQAVDPLYNPALMVDLSQGYDLLGGFDPSRVQSGMPPRAYLPGPGVVGFAPPPALLSGPGLVGLYGLFEGDFRRVGDDAPAAPPPRRRGLLLLGAKSTKKAWKPRRLAASTRRGVLGGWPHVVSW